MDKAQENRRSLAKRNQNTLIERYSWEREYSFGRLVFPGFAGAYRTFFSRAVVFSGKDLCPFFEFQGRRVLLLMHPSFGMFGVSLFSSVMEKKNVAI